MLDHRKVIHHRKARRLIQRRLDGALTPTDSAILDGHLGECHTCRRAWLELSQVDAALRGHYSTINASPGRELSYSLDHRAIDSISQKSRAKMRTAQPMRAAGFAALALALAILTITLAFFLRAQFPAPVAPAGLVKATQTPIPATEETANRSTPEAILEDPAEINQILDELAGKFAAQFRQPGWAHFQKRNLGGEGAIQSSYWESWNHFPGEDGACAEMLAITKDKEDGPDFLQYVVRLADGRAGDLIEYRKGATAGERMYPAAIPCQMTTAESDAGYLAKRIAGEERIKGPSELVSVQAWYETSNGKRMFVVEAKFGGEGNVPPVQVEKRSFDVTIGQLEEETIRMEWEDGSLFGEFSDGFTVEFLAEPPVEVMQAYTLAAAELGEYLERELTPQAQVSPTPVSTPANMMLGNLSYTPAQPLNDGVQILAILRTLHQQHLDWMSREGWYLYREQYQGKIEDLDRHVLMHVFSGTDGNLTCDWMSYYLREGQKRPQEIHLADGTWGLIGTVDAGEFTEGAAGGAEGDDCRIEGLETVQNLESYIDLASEMVNGELEGELRGWVENLGRREVFVLETQVQYGTPRPMIMDPETRLLEPQSEALEWQYFELQSGGWVGGAGLYTLVNGNVIGAAHDPDTVLVVEYQAFKELPAELRALYEETAAKLQAYLEGLNPDADLR